MIFNYKMNNYEYYKTKYLKHKTKYSLMSGGSGRRPIVKIPEREDNAGPSNAGPSNQTTLVTPQSIPMTPLGTRDPDKFLPFPTSKAFREINQNEGNCSNWHESVGTL